MKQDDVSIQGELERLSNALTTATMKYVDMLCAAFTCRHGYGPIIASDATGSKRWMVHPQPAARIPRSFIEEKIAKQELELLAARYAQLTDIPPDHAMVSVDFEMPEGEKPVIRVHYVRREPETRRES